jgi:hypothetical protein
MLRPTSSAPFLSASIALWLGFLAACGNPGQGSLSPENRTELTSFALRNTDTSKKYFKLAEVVAQLIEEASAQGSNEAAMGRIRKFRTDNDLALRMIAKEFDGWQRHVDHDELMHFVYVLNQQPYARQLRNLAPRFRRRISGNDQYLREFDELMSFLEMRG